MLIHRRLYQALDATHKKPSARRAKRCQKKLALRQDAQYLELLA
jgi:hypothetical protein